MSISVAQAQKMIDKLRDDEISLGRAPSTWYTYENHVYGVARIAKRIASKISSMDANRLYVMALLHDISRTEDDREQRFHGILGYEKLVRLDEDVARSCLLHTFPWNKLPSYDECEKLFYRHPKDYEFTAHFLKNNPPKEEDFLIQLCDALANRNGFVTIEERANEIRERHSKLNVAGFMDIDKVNEIKDYFESKINCNVYDLFQIKNL